MDVTVDNLIQTYNEGNHGEQGNPHPQYQPYVYYTPSNATYSSNPLQWAKIADQTLYMPDGAYLTGNPKAIAAPTPKRIFMTFLLDSTQTDSGFLSAIVNLRFNVYQNLANSRFAIDVTPLTEGDNVSLASGQRYLPDDLIRMYITDNANGTYRMQVFIKYFTTYQTWKLKMLQSDFSSGYIDYNNTDYKKSWNGFYGYQNENRMAKWFFQNAGTAIINENDASFPVTSASTILIKNSIVKGTLAGNTLPTPSASYMGKIFTVDGNNSTLTTGNDTVFVCLKQGGTFQWLQLNPQGLMVTPNTNGTASQWTKIASAKLTAQYGVVVAEFNISGGQSGSSTSTFAKLYWRVKQQNAMAGVPTINLVMLEGYGINKENFVSVTSQNDATATIVDLYVKVDTTYEVLQYTCPMNRAVTGGLTFTPNTAFIASLPAGTQTSTIYGDTNVQQVGSLPTASVSYRGKIVYVQGNGSTTADIAYICLLSATGTYSWKQLISG